VGAGAERVNDLPLWQVLLMHLAPVLGSLAAWRSAARSGKTSSRNEATLGTVQFLVNGNLGAVKAELAAVTEELAILRAEMQRREDQGRGTRE
jgi:hypothetical protein